MPSIVAAVASASMTAGWGRVLEQVAALAVCLSLLACQPSPSAAPTAASSPPGTATGTSSSPSPAPSTPVTGDPRVDGWRDDLARIIPGLERIHPDPFHGTPKADFEAAVAALAAEVPDATDDELLIGVLRIVALISAGGCDGHSGAFIWGTGTYPVDSLPFRLWLFGDELVIVDALPPHEGLIGARIDAVEGRPIADVRAALDPVIPRDNDQTVRLLAPRYLLIPQVLRGLGLADDGAISIDLTAQDGTTSSLDVEPVPMAEYNAWAGPYGLHLPVDPDVRYLSNIAEDLWWEVLPDGESLYVQYNRVEHLSPATLADLSTALRGEDDRPRDPRRPPQLRRRGAGARPAPRGARPAGGRRAGRVVRARRTEHVVGRCAAPRPPRGADLRDIHR